PRLKEFLRLVEGGPPVALEFRHESWLDDEVFDSLRASAAALCIADVDDREPPRLVTTTPWGYLRLRREHYEDRELTSWLENLRAASWQEVYMFFKHEDAGVGPKLAARFLELASC